MDEPIEDRVAKRGVADEIVPVLHGDLARDERSASAGTILNEFEQIPALAVSEGRDPPVIEDEQVRLGELLEELAVGAIAAGERQFAE